MKAVLEGINTATIRDEREREIHQVVIEYLSDTPGGQAICQACIPKVMFRFLDTNGSKAPMIVQFVQERFPRVLFLQPNAIRYYLTSPAQHEPMMELLRGCLLG
jgi:hypothetical protein